MLLGCGVEVFPGENAVRSHTQVHFGLVSGAFQEFHRRRIIAYLQILGNFINCPYDLFCADDLFADKSARGEKSSGK